MKRRFTETVLRETGEVKFPAGLVRDYPKPTWQQIAASIGKDLDAFSAPTEEALRGKVFTASKEPEADEAPKAERKKRKADRPRRRAKLLH